MPTENQKRVAVAVLEKIGKGGKISISKEMGKVKYSKSYSKNPQRLTKSKGWKEIMEEQFPNSLLAQKHKALLEKQETIAKNNMTTGEIEVIKTGEIDVNAVKSGLDMAYKLKKLYPKEEMEITHLTYDNIIGQGQGGSEKGIRDNK